MVLNIFGFSQMLYDKKRAITNQRRIPENRLLLVAALGGALGSLIGMQTARHKTKIWKFLIGMPFLLVMNIVIFYPIAVFGIDAWITYVIYILGGS
jgi:uncharacterized membrane protein YsdA (DUF1294 family)